MGNHHDIALLAAVAGGDQKAFGELFARHKDRMYTVAITYTDDPATAEEVVQDVFLRVWKNRHRLGEIADFPAWLYTISRNRALTALNKIAREAKKKDEFISYLPPGINEAEQKIDEYHLQQLLESAMARLTKQQRRVFELSRLKGYSREEVAAILGLAPATVSVHLTIALRTIRAFLVNRIEFPLAFLLLTRYL